MKRPDQGDSLKCLLHSEEVNPMCHFQRGIDGCPTVFVYSCPGSEEEAEGYPCAGITGDHLQQAIVLLQNLDPIRFPYLATADYRITNAWPNVEYMELTGRYEATGREIAHPDNMTRLHAEIMDCPFVVACGRRARSAVRRLQRYYDLNARSAYACHLSQRGLNSMRRPNNQERIARWVEIVLAQLS